MLAAITSTAGPSTLHGFGASKNVIEPYWSSEGRSFVVRSLNPCPENFSQNVVDYPNLLRGGGNLLHEIRSS